MSLDSTSFTLSRLWTRPLGRIVFAFALCFLQAAAASAQLIISEFRVRGPNGANDEFIEIHNATGTDHTVAASSGTGYGVAASDGVIRCSIPNGTVIPSRGHYLCVNSVAYSLASYPAGNGTTATGDATYTTDIPDNAGIAIFNNNVLVTLILANRLDAVGSTSEADTLYKEGSGYAALTPFSIDYSFTRRPAAGCTGSGGGGNCNSLSLIQTTPGPTTTQVQDTGDNASDFMFVDTNGTSAGAGQRLGAGGPENLSSPIATDGVALAVSALDSCRVNDVSPNHVRDLTSEPFNNSTFGTIDIRRTFTNNSGGAITRLRFRIVDITTFPSITGVADLRARTSSDVAVTVDRPPCDTGTSAPTVRGTTLEQPPSQPNGSGYGGTLSVGAITLGTPLGSGASVDVRFLMGIQQTGAARFCVAAETLPASSSQVLCFVGTTEGMVRHTLQTYSNSTAIVIPATGTGAVTGAPATPYPSTIAIAGITNQVTKVTVTLKQISHTFPSDVDVLLVGPTGVKFILMSDVIGGTDFAGQTYTFDDGAAALISNSGAPPASGSFKPSNYGGGDLFPVPAPASPYLTPGTAGTSMLAAFNGLNPNGTWSLYVVDDTGTDIGTFAGGWDLAITSSCTAPLGAVTADFNGDCASDLAVFRPTTGEWLVRNQGTVQWGIPGDIPVAGDYNGDGTTDRAAYRPSTGFWYVQGQGQVQWGIPGDIPVPSDYDGDGTTDRAVYRPSTGYWYVQGQGQVQWGIPGDTPMPGDYNGDGTTDRAVYRPSTGTWLVQNQTSAQWGVAGDIPVPGDYNGDGTTDRAVYRPSTGTWFVQNQSSVPWGAAGDIPVPGDYDGNGTLERAVYRPSTATWLVQGQAVVQWGLSGDVPVLRPDAVGDVNGDGTSDVAGYLGDFDGNGTSDIAVYRPSTGTWYAKDQSASQFGAVGDIPVAGDYNGDGTTDRAVYRPSTGTWYVQGQGQVQWGTPGDIPVPSDYNGDGTTDRAIYRPSTGYWYVQGQGQVPFGLPGDIPMPGDYNGDGTTDRAVYRPSTGTWYVQSQGQVPWGLPGDIPVPGDYNGDGTTDRAVYRPSTGTWYVQSQGQVQWGLPGDIPVPGDYNGSGTMDRAVYRPSTATWFVQSQPSVQWGQPGDFPASRAYSPQWP